MTTTPNKQSTRSTRTTTTNKRKAKQHHCLSPNTKKARDAVASKLAEDVFQAQINSACHKDRYGCVRKLVNDAKKVYPWVNENAIKCRAKRIKRVKSTVSIATISTPCPLADDTNIKVIGRPKGTTQKAMEDIETRKKKAKIAITQKFR